ncbi:MAG: DNA recombination protein RmuC [Rhodospirillales bacterium]|jgi:DNA recombination protein RmuC|nr:DNA recombination protein RmuC [Rhodospirillales bacterium]MBT4039248.1 DNA recombination protein RmuC [Rhodospirillales bacterium]MBT4626924.1 DNA recombination protein RmuC [Rhodospirillales bacterium]MBT5352484.1 DNA recombination protein RmuC [Rhodospirillales bacterium]MBT5521099.1 DNA recombination protein RmuC [Rhodospirillales bacterium]
MFSDSLIIVLVVVAVVVLAGVIVFSGRRRRDDDLALTSALMSMQETTSRISTEHTALNERMGTNQSVLADRLQQTQVDLNQRLESLHQRLGDGMAKQTQKTGESLNVLHERLAVIDAAQKNITDLSQQMVGLQDILSNKQARGAFGEIQLNDLVSDILPPSAYQTQATLSNGKRADCLLLLPLPPGPIVIDAKYPMESYKALQAATDDQARVQAERAFSTDVSKHVKDIAEKYIIPNETAESAIMFLPSEAIYAEIHANHKFQGILEDSYRRRVWIVSPTTLMATLNTVRAILRDVRMKEQAGVIQKEVHELTKDVGRLDERVGKLKTHFSQAEKDITEIDKSTRKITSRGDKIEAVQLGDDTSPVDDLPISDPTTPDRVIG